MGPVSERLAEHNRVGLDTSIFIYHLEAHPRYLLDIVIPHLDKPAQSCYNPHNVLSHPLR